MGSAPASIMRKRLHAAPHAEKQEAAGQGGRSAFKAQQPMLHGMVSIAKSGDLPAIMGLIAKGAQEGKLVPRSEGEVEADIKLGGAFVYRLKSGIGGITFLSIYSAALAEIRSFYVDEGHRSNGAGTALVESALAIAQKLRITEVLAITKQDNEGWFGKFGFCRRNGFQTALFRKKGEGQGMAPEPHVQNATLQDMPALLRLMERGGTGGQLIPRSNGEILADMKQGNAFVYRQYDGGNIEGMAFLSEYSGRLAEIRSLYVKAEAKAAGDAEAALVRSAVARGDGLGVNEIMAIVKNGNGHAFSEAGFAQELHNFRIALFRELER